MEHDRAVRWRKELHNLWNNFGIKRKDVEIFGDPWYIARAEQFLKNNEIEVNWVSGDCENGSNLDIVLRVPSESGKFKSYDTLVKLERINNPDQTGNLLKLINNSSGCKHTLYNEDVCRVPGKNKQEIAAIKFIERNFGKIIEEYAPNLKDYDICKIYIDADTPYFIRDEYDKQDMDLYIKLTEEKLFGIIGNRGIFYKHLKKKYI